MDNKKPQSFQTYRPGQPNVYGPRGPIVGKYYIPEKKLNEETISKLFLAVSEGNFLKIKDFILSNEISMSAKNDSGESVLHTIIKNSNISSNEKLDLVQLAINNGAQVVSFDKSNICHQN